jgi:anti-anti-sigma factor
LKASARFEKIAGTFPDRLTGETGHSDRADGTRSSGGSEDVLTPPDARETEPTAQPGGALEVDLGVRLSGELIRDTVREFEKTIRLAMQASPREIVVDMTGIDRIDEAGLTVLLKAHLRSRQRGLPIRFVPADHEAVKQVAAVTGTDEASD